MSLDMAKAKGKGGDFPQVPEGTHLALPVQIVDLGLQLETDWQSGEPVLDDSGAEQYKPKVFITSEFPEVISEFDGVDKPLWVGKMYTFSDNEKSGLVKLIRASHPSTKILGDLIGKAYMATIGRTSGGKAKITDATPAPNKLAFNDELVEKGSIKLFNDPVVYDMDDGENDILSSLPQWLQDLVEEGRINNQTQGA